MSSAKKAKRCLRTAVTKRSFDRGIIIGKVLVLPDVSDFNTQFMFTCTPPFKTLLRTLLWQTTTNITMIVVIIITTIISPHCKSSITT